MKSKSKFKIVLSAALAVSVVFSTFAFLNVSADQNDQYGTYEDGISGNKAKIMSVEISPEFNNSNFEDGLRYWGVNSPGAPHTATASPEKDDEDNTYAKLRVTGYAGLFSAPFTVSGVNVGDTVGLRFKMKKTAGDGSIRAWVLNKNYDNSPAASDNITPTENWETYYVKTSLSSLTLADDSVVNNKGKFLLAVSFTGNNVSAAGLEVCIDDVEIIKIYKDSNNNYFAYTDSDGNWYNGCNEPLYGTENDGIIRSGENNNSITKRINNLNAIPALEKIDNFDFSKGLVNFGTMNKSSSKKSLAEDGTTLYTDSTGNKMIKIESTAAVSYFGFRSVFIKLADAAKGKEVFVACDAQTSVPLMCKINQLVDGSPIETGWGDSQVLSYASNDEGLKRVITKGMAVEQNATAVSVDIRQQQYGSSAGFGTSYIDNLSLYYIDNGGKSLPASIDGTPIGYEMGDVNADSDINICDLVAMNNKMNGEEEAVYFAAAKLDGTANETITDNDILAMRSKLLNK